MAVFSYAYEAGRMSVMLTTLADHADIAARVYDQPADVTLLRRRLAELAATAHEAVSEFRVREASQAAPPAPAGRHARPATGRQEST